MKTDKKQQETMVEIMLHRKLTIALNEKKKKSHGANIGVPE
jgi:hypothetical protein